MIAFSIKTIEKFKHHKKKSSFSTAPSVHDNLVHLFNFTDLLFLSFKRFAGCTLCKQADYLKD